MIDQVFDFGLFQVGVSSTPELLALHGVPQPVKHHPEVDTLLHVSMVQEQARRLTDNPAVHFAALLHDLGKGLTRSDRLPSHQGHEEAGVALVHSVCDRIPEVPDSWRTLARLVCEYHTHCHRCHDMTPRAMRKFLTHMDAWAQPERFDLFLLACEADARGRTGFEDREYPQSRYLLDFIARAPVPVNVEHKHRMMGESLVKRLTEMPLDARLDVFSQFCMDCGEPKMACGCASSGVKI